MPPVIPRPQGSTSSADSKVYAVYAEMPAGYEVVNSGPVLNYADGGWAGWSCPAGKMVTGGGFALTVLAAGRSRRREHPGRRGPITRSLPGNVAGSCETPQTGPLALVVRSTPSASLIPNMQLRPADSCDFRSVGWSPIVHESCHDRPLSGERHFGAARLRHEPIAFLCDRSDDRSMGRRRRAR